MQQPTDQKENCKSCKYCMDNPSIELPGKNRAPVNTFQCRRTSPQIFTLIKGVQMGTGIGWPMLEHNDSNWCGMWAPIGAPSIEDMLQRALSLTGANIVNVNS